MDTPTTQLRKFRFVAWAVTALVGGAVFLLSSPLWDGHFHPVAALIGAVVMATVISIKERDNDYKEAPFRAMSAPIFRLQWLVEREEITRNAYREACREIVEKAPPEYRPKLRRIAFADDPVQELIACREDYEACLRYYEERLVDIIEAGFNRGCSTTGFQKQVREKITHCQERLRYIDAQLNDLAASSPPRDTDR